MSVTLAALEDAFLFADGGLDGESFVYLDRETGSFCYISEYIDDPELPDGYEDADDLDGDDRFVLVPHKRELDLGQPLIHEFVREYLPDEVDRVYDIFRRKGAYRRYKDFLASKDSLETWYRFENERTHDALREWCTEKGIELAD